LENEDEKIEVDTVKLPKLLKEKPAKKMNTLSFGDELNECKYLFVLSFHRFLRCSNVTIYRFSQATTAKSLK